MLDAIDRQQIRDALKSAAYSNGVCYAWQVGSVSDTAVHEEATRAGLAADLRDAWLRGYHSVADRRPALL